MVCQSRDLNVVRLCVVLGVCLMCFLNKSESAPVYPTWFDYDYFPVAKPIQDEGTGQVVGTVNPLRPYEPWILDCILYSTDKVEEGKRHERCKDVDETNEKEYAKYLFYVTQWEEAYPDRAAKWNARFPDAKAKEKQRYEQLKGYADAHNPNLPRKSSSSGNRSTKKPHPTPRNCSPPKCSHAKPKGSELSEGEVVPTSSESLEIPENP